MLYPSHMPALPVTARFAGFAWPRYLATLPHGPLAQRLAERRRPPVTGPYFVALGEGGPRGFYLGDPWQPARRWTWADEVSGSGIRHRGWRCNPDDVREGIRGMVLHLSHGRHLAGWSMGEGMLSCVWPEVYTDPCTAADMADEHARVAAEAELERAQAERAELHPAEDD